MTTDVWRKQVDFFGKSRSVIAIDPRGQGGSGGRDANVLPNARAADLAALLDRTAAIRRLCLPLMIVAADGPGADRMQAFAASLPAGRFERIADAGHALFLDRPEAFNTLLESFFDHPRRPDCAANS